jgi:Glycosyl hydrolase family 36 C-terminal domain
VVLVFRRPHTKTATMRFILHGLDAGKHYRIDNFDESGTELLSGKSLMQHGLEISLSDAPASAIVQYERQSLGSS